MRWVSDSSHFTPEAGAIVLDRMRGVEVPGGELGVRLTPQNLEGQLERMRRDRLEWRTRHPADVAEIEAMADEPANPARARMQARRRSP
jgi:hypothetical protein